MPERGGAEEAVSHEVRDGIVVARPLPLSMGEAFRRLRSNEPPLPGDATAVVSQPVQVSLEAGYRRLR
jgi:hypothetical protein